MAIVKQRVRRLAIAAVVIATAALAAQKPAHALDTGAAVGIGLGSFALGSMLGSTANPYPYGYSYPAPAYLPARALLPSAAELLGPVLPPLLRMLSIGAARSLLVVTQPR